MISHYSSDISNTTLHRLWDIIPSSSIYVKVINFISSVKVDNGLLLYPLNKIGMPFLNTWVRGNVEDNPGIIYPFNYGKDIFYTSQWIGGHI